MNDGNMIYEIWRLDPDVVLGDNIPTLDEMRICGKLVSTHSDARCAFAGRTWLRKNREGHFIVYNVSNVVHVRSAPHSITGHTPRIVVCDDDRTRLSGDSNDSADSNDSDAAAMYELMGRTTGLHGLHRLRDLLMTAGNWFKRDDVQMLVSIFATGIGSIGCAIAFRALADDLDDTHALVLLGVGFASFSAGLIGIVKCSSPGPFED